MNYIELINQFWQTRRRVRLSSAEADLYFCLLQECNLRDWANPFECPNGLICATIGMCESTLIDVRNRLQQKGLIRFEAGSRKAKSPVYRILYFENPSKNTSITRGKNTSKNTSKNGGTPYIKKTKTIIEDKSSIVTLTSNSDELPLGLEKSPNEFCDRVKVFFNGQCKNFRPVSVLTDKRKQAINARKREHGEQAVFEMLKNAGKSAFLAGQNDRGWCADFDWLFKPTNFVKVLENKYANKEQSASTVGGSHAAANDRISFTANYGEGF